MLDFSRYAGKACAYGKCGRGCPAAEFFCYRGQLTANIFHAHTRNPPDTHINSATMDQSDAFGESPPPDQSVRDAYDAWAEQCDTDENATRDLNTKGATRAFRCGGWTSGTGRTTTCPGCCRFSSRRDRVSAPASREADCFTWNALSGRKGARKVPCLFHVKHARARKRGDFRCFTWNDKGTYRAFAPLKEVLP